MSDKAFRRVVFDDDGNFRTFQADTLEALEEQIAAAKRLRAEELAALGDKGVPRRLLADVDGGPLWGQP